MMDIKEKLILQEKIIIEVILHSTFLEVISKEIELNESYLKENPDVAFLRYNSIKLLILELSKLLNHNEDISYSRTINSSEFNLNKVKGNDSDKDEINVILKSLTKIFYSSNINKIRNEHVGHTDLELKKYNITINEIVELVNQTIKFHKALHKLITNNSIIFEAINNPLITAFTKLKQRNSIFHLVRQAFNFNKNKIERDEIWEIFKN